MYICIRDKRWMDPDSPSPPPEPSAWSKVARRTTTPILTPLKNRLYHSPKQIPPFRPQEEENSVLIIQPSPPCRRPRQVFRVPRNLGFRVYSHFTSSSLTLAGVSLPDQNHCSEDSRNRASLVSRSLPPYALSHTRHSISSHWWRRINRYSLCDSLSPCGVLASDSPSDTFFLRSERDRLRQQVSSHWLSFESF